MPTSPQDPDGFERQTLQDEMDMLVAEARMVLPGVQALFGFQTMAVFNQKFADLPDSTVAVYLAGLGLLALAIALLMTPAAYHRMAERGRVSHHMIKLSSRLISAGMVPLMLALALDVYVVIVAALGRHGLALLCGALTLGVFVTCWFVVPLARRHRLR